MSTSSRVSCAYPSSPGVFGVSNKPPSVLSKSDWLQSVHPPCLKDLPLSLGAPPCLWDRGGGGATCIIHFLNDQSRAFFSLTCTLVRNIILRFVVF